MKTWDDAKTPGSCASDRSHTWKANARIIVVSTDKWRKTYCGACGMRNFGLPPDTGEVLDVTDVPAYPAVLKPVYQTPAPEDPLFAEPFEEDKPMPFDGRMAALPVGDRD